MNEQDKDQNQKVTGEENSAADNAVEGQIVDNDDNPTDLHADQQDVEAANEDNLAASDASPELNAAFEEIAKLKDAYLRAKAEEDNVRRRTEKEVANSRKFAVEGFAKEMLQVRDSLKLAVAVELAEDANESIKSVHEGVNITLKQLDAAFAKFSLKEIAPEVGDKLDPNLHQAMSIVESEDVASGCILNVIQAGFQLHDRLLRPAMVVVAK